MQSYKRRNLLKYGIAAAVLTASGVSARAGSVGGRLTVGLSGASPLDSWDARTFSDSFMIACGQGAVFDCLTEVTADGSLVGELAESWESSADGRIWTVALRRGVTFHNGKPFVAQDVIDSFNLHRGTSSGARVIVDGVQDISRLSDHQVRFTLTSGNADFPYLLSDYHLIIYPSGQIDEAIAQGIGTGLYRVESFEPGVRFVGRRVQSHYKDGTAGWFDRVEFVAMNDRARRMNALLTGQVDAVDRVDPAAVSRLSTHPRINVVETTGNMHLAFGMRTDTAPFDDLNVRLALKHGIDRQAIVDRVLNGHGRVAADSPIGPANQFFANLAPLSHDPDRAAWHLRQAGLSSVSVDLFTSDAAMNLSAAEEFRTAAASAGIDIQINEAPSVGYWGDTFGKQAFAATYWSGRVTEDWMLSTAYHAGSPWNSTRWADGRFEQLLVAARAEFDPDLRSELYAEMQLILRDQGSAIIPAFANWIGATSDRVGRPASIGNLWPMDNARMAERWWIA